MPELLTIPRNGGKELRVSLDEYKGNHFLNMRVFFNAGGGVMRPGKQGCTVPISALPAFAHAARQAEVLARIEGLLPALDNVSQLPLNPDDAA